MRESSGIDAEHDGTVCEETIKAMDRIKTNKNDLIFLTPFHPLFGFEPLEYPI